MKTKTGGFGRPWRIRQFVSTSKIQVQCSCLDWKVLAMSISEEGVLRGISTSHGRGALETRCGCLFNHWGEEQEATSGSRGRSDVC